MIEPEKRATWIAQIALFSPSTLCMGIRCHGRIHHPQIVVLILFRVCFVALLLSYYVS